MNAIIDTPATVALDALTAVLSKSVAAGNGVLVKAYGAGTDAAAVKLATAAVRQLAGLTKPGQGGTAQRTNNVVKLIRQGSLTDVTAVTAARTVLDAHRAAVAAQRDAAKAAKALDSEVRAAAKAVLNDRGAAKADRIAALEVMTEIDNKGERAKTIAAWYAFEKAVETFKAAGFKVDDVAVVLGDVYGRTMAVERVTNELVAA